MGKPPWTADFRFQGRRSILFCKRQCMLHILGCHRRTGDGRSAAAPTGAGGVVIPDARRKRLLINSYICGPRRRISNITTTISFDQQETYIPWTCVYDREYKHFVYIFSCLSLTHPRPYCPECLCAMRLQHHGPFLDCAYIEEVSTRRRSVEGF